MERPPGSGLTAAEGRKFGIPLGIAFGILAAILAWRGHAPTSLVFVGLGLGLVLAALTVPTHLGPVLRAWMGLALALSKVTTPIFMGITFFLVVTPIGLLMRLLGHNAMVRRPVGGSYWITRAEGTARRSNLERQF